MPDTYTPTTGEVRDTFAAFHYTSRHGSEVATEFDRWLAQEQAKAWDEGALWAAVECGVIANEHGRFLAPGDNPYRARLSSGGEG